MATNVRLLRRSEVELRCSLSRSEIYRRLERGEFPVPLAIGGRAVRWLEHEIVGWIESHPRSETHAPCSGGVGPSPEGE